MTDLRPSFLSDAIPLFRFHFGRNNCLEPLERRVAVALLPPNGSREAERSSDGTLISIWFLYYETKSTVH